MAVADPSAPWMAKYRGLISCMTSGKPVTMKTDMEFYPDGIAFQLNHRWYRTSRDLSELLEESRFLCTTFPTIFRPEMFASLLAPSKVRMIPWDSERSVVAIHDPPAWHEAWCLNKNPVDDWQQRALLRRWEMDVHRLRFHHEPSQCQCQYSSSSTGPTSTGSIRVVHANTGVVLVQIPNLPLECIQSMYRTFRAYF